MLIGKKREIILSRVRILFAAMCVNELVFRRAKEVLGSRDFGLQYSAMRFVLDVLYEYWDEYETLPPTTEVLRMLLMSDLQSQMATTESISDVTEIFNLTTQLSQIDAARLATSINEYLDIFVEGLIRSEVSVQLEIGDLAQVLKINKDKLQQAQATNADRFVSIFDEAPWQGRFIPTGHSLVDLYCGGTGPATGDVIGHAAVRGGGKSTWISQIASLVARTEREKAELDSRPPRFVYIFNYEDVKDPLSHTQTFNAQVERNAIDNVVIKGDYSGLTTRGNYKPYEYARWGGLIEATVREYELTGIDLRSNGEAERLIEARSQMRQNLMICNFTPSSRKFANLAKTWVEGLKNCIEEHQILIGKPGVEAVFLDYAGCAARSHMQLIKSSDDTERRLIEALPLQLKHEVSYPFDCFTWVSHQLAADEASKAPGSRPDPNKFKSCKSFAENCDYAFVNGVPTMKGKYMICVNSKARRGEVQPDQILQLNGRFAAIDHITSTHQIVGGRIVDSQDIQSFRGSNDRFAVDMQN